MQRQGHTECYKDAVISVETRCINPRPDGTDYLHTESCDSPSGCEHASCLQVLDRGERIELLVDKTDHLQNESFAFKREARRLKSRLWWKNTRLLVFLAVLVLVIAYIIVCFACSPNFQC